MMPGLNNDDAMDVGDARKRKWYGMTMTMMPLLSTETSQICREDSNAKHN
jgi:hypothetical protein